MKEKIIGIIIQSLENLNEEWNNPDLEHIDVGTRIYGSGGNVDSLGLVTLITDLEERLESEFLREIVLADEKAMSQQNSPFRSVESLSNYIEHLIQSETRNV